MCLPFGRSPEKRGDRILYEPQSVFGIAVKRFDIYCMSSQVVLPEIPGLRHMRSWRMFIINSRIRDPRPLGFPEISTWHI